MTVALLSMCARRLAPVSMSMRTQEKARKHAADVPAKERPVLGVARRLLTPLPTQRNQPKETVAAPVTEPQYFWPHLTITQAATR